MDIINNQSRQDIEDQYIQQHCEEEAERLFLEQLEYSDRHKEEMKYLYGEEYNSKKIYGGVIIPTIPRFIAIYPNAKSKWDNKNTHEEIIKLLNIKLSNYEKNIDNNINT
jgi:hypothetical protein